MKAPFSFQGEAGPSAQVGTALRNAADLLRTQRGEVFEREILEIVRDVKNWVVVSNIFYFHPYLGKIPILTNIFQMG